MIIENVSRKIKSVQFGLFSPEEIKNNSVVHILHPETIESNFPKEDGLIDLRMGTIDKEYNCLTCNLSSFSCPGHFGHIELTKPMFHIGFISKIKKVLECVCFYCSKLKTNIKTDNLEDAWNLLKNKTICDSQENDTKTGCMNKQPVIKKEGLSLIAFVKNDEGKIILNGEKVFSIFKKIKPQDYQRLGFNENCKPEFMLIINLMVSPPCVRPSIKNNLLRGEDDLTHKYADIIKANNYLKKYENEGAPSHILRDYESLLQFHISTLINNDINGIPQALQKNNRPLKSITARLKGKEGRIRGNLMGKRVDFSARSVITPDSNISVDEVGIPYEVAKNLTFPEKVNRMNIGFLQEMVNNGPNKHPGANYVIRNDSQRIDLNFNKHQIKLETGFVVERHILNKDYVLFNRQPSLHKMSMMGHRARVMENKTFRLNLSVTQPYNADFDGDEMNLHMPQSYNAVSELKHLATVKNQIISPQSNRPIINIVQDTLLGLNLMTQKDKFFTRREAFGLMYSAGLSRGVTPCILSPAELYSGKQIISLLMGPTLIYEDPIKDPLPTYNLTDKALLIRNSQILTGSINKAKINKLIHINYREYSSAASKAFIDQVQRIINHYILYINSFSVGIGDTKITLNAQVESSIKSIDTLIETARTSRLEKLPGLSIMGTFENRINTILNKVRDNREEISLNNNLFKMVLSGSKGSNINISQIGSCVGQQNVEGQRIRFGFYNRTLPHFYKFDYNPLSKGFVKNSYLQGLNPFEFYFHAMGGREGLIDTAIKTAETGYIQRRLVKAMEDLTIRDDYSVRNSSGKVYQFLYGEDSFNSICLEGSSLDLSKATDVWPSFLKKIQSFSLYANSDVRFLVENDLLLKNLILNHYSYINSFSLSEPVYYGPLNIQRLLKIHCSYKVKDVISPYTILSKIKELLIDTCVNSVGYENIKEVILHKFLEGQNSKGSSLAQDIFSVSCQEEANFMNFLFRKEVFDYEKAVACSPEGCRYSLNSYLAFYLLKNLDLPFLIFNFELQGLESLFENIKKKVVNSRVPCNEMVGTISAQSVGEPATQMTLNTFHLAGVSNTVTMGVPRLNEIINLSKKIKTPNLKIKLIENDLKNANLIKNKIEYLIIKDIYQDIKLLYKDSTHDRALVEAYNELPDEDQEENTTGDFCIRLSLKRYAVISRALSMRDISTKIRKYFAGQGVKTHTICAEDNSEALVIRVSFYKNEEIETLKESLRKILKIHIGGYENIKRVYLCEEKEAWYLMTDGINFSSLLSFPNIDGRNVIPNDFFIIYEALGIEAARAAILNELILVMENNGSYVNFRHLALLGDVMTISGYLTGITRHGINRENANNPLKRASFEETVDILLDAASMGQLNATRGITENLMLGQLASLGTGNVKILLDVEKINRKMDFALNTEIEAESNENSVLSNFSSASVFSPEYDINKAPVLSNRGNLSMSYLPNVSSTYVPSTYYTPSNSYTPMSSKYSPMSSALNLYSPSFSPKSSKYTLSNSYNPLDSPSYKIDDNYNLDEKEEESKQETNN